MKNQKIKYLLNDHKEDIQTLAAEQLFRPFASCPRPSQTCSTFEASAKKYD